MEEVKETTVNNEVDYLTVEEMTKIVGREVKDKADFLKHYENLSGYTKGDKIQKLREQVEAAQIVGRWLQEANIDVTKVNPVEAGQVIKAMEVGEDVVARSGHQDKRQDLINTIKTKHNSEEAQVALAKELFSK